MNISVLHQLQLKRSFVGIQNEAATILVANALRYVIKHVFVEISPTLVITLAALSRQINDWFLSLLEMSYDTWSIAAVQLIRHNFQSPHFVSGKTFCNLLLVDSYEALRATNIVANNAQSDSLEYYFIYLQAYDALIPNELQLIMDYCLKNFWIHCNVMVQTAKLEILVYSYFPFSETSCHKAHPVLINQFDGRIMSNANMFPDKLQNMYGCPLMLLTYHNPPYVELKYKFNDDGVRELAGADGYESYFAKHLAETLNFTLKFMTYDIIGNGAPTTIAPTELIPPNNIANLSMGYFRVSLARSRVMTATMTHYYTPLVAIVSREQYGYTSLEILTFPFNSTVWLLLCAAAVSYASLQLLERILLPSLRQHFVLPISVLLLGISLTSSKLPKTLFQRLICLKWLLGTIPLRVSYQALLFHLLRTQMFRDGPTSIETLFDYNYEAQMLPYTYLLIEDQPYIKSRQFRHKIVNTAIEWEVLKHFEQDLRTKHAVYALVAKDIAFLYVRLNNLENNWHILPENINQQQMVMYLPKHSYLVDKFDDVLRDVDMLGLSVAWHRWCFENILPRRDVEDDMKLFENSIRLTKLKEGIFIVLCVMFTLSLFVFLLELCTKRYKITYFGMLQNE